MTPKTIRSILHSWGCDSTYAADELEAFLGESIRAAEAEAEKRGAEREREECAEKLERMAAAQKQAEKENPRPPSQSIVQVILNCAIAIRSRGADAPNQEGR